MCKPIYTRGLHFTYVSKYDIIVLDKGKELPLSMFFEIEREVII